MPDEVDVADVFTPVELLVADIVAFGITDPLGSLTVPLIDPVPLVWATRVVVKQMANKAAARRVSKRGALKITRLLRGIFGSSLLGFALIPEFKRTELTYYP